MINEHKYTLIGITNLLYIYIYIYIYNIYNDINIVASTSMKPSNGHKMMNNAASSLISLIDIMCDAIDEKICHAFFNEIPEHPYIIYIINNPPTTT